MVLKVLLKNTAWSMLNHILSRGILMLSTIFLARNLLVEEFAKYSYFYMTVTMLATYCSLGLGVAISKSFSELTYEKNKYNNDSVKNIIGISFLLPCVICTIIFFLPRDLLLSKAEISPYLFIFSILVVSLSTLPSNALIGMEEYKKLTLISLFSSIFLIIGCLLTVYKNDVYYFIVFYIISTLLYIIISFKFIVNKIQDVSFLSLFKFDFSLVKKIFFFSWPLLVVSLLNAASGWLIGKKIFDVYGGYYFSIYTIGLQWFALALFIPGMISRVLLPRMIIDKNNNRSNLIYSSIFSVICAILISGVSFIFNDYLIGFYGDMYASAKKYLSSIIALSIIYAAANTLGNAIVLKVGSIYWLIVSIIWFFILNLIFYYFIEFKSIYSVLYAHIFSGVTLLFLSLFICKKKGLL